MKNQLACLLKEFLLRHEISEELAYSLLTPPDEKNKSKIPKLRESLSAVYHQPETIGRFNQELITLAETAQIKLGFEIPANQGKTFTSVVLYVLSTVFAVVLAPIAILTLLYLIIAGASNLSITYHVSPLAVLLIFLGLTLLLAALEGSQISIVSLRTKDLSELEKEFPRTTAIQNQTKSTADSQKYLAGRQFFVIFVVFLIAQSTSFPNAQDYLPAFMKSVLESFPLLDLTLLKLGFLGAFVTLWFGQLAPQFFANKNPQAMLNVMGMRSVVNLCFLFESFGLARPGGWLVAHLKPGAAIAVSKREEYQKASLEAGYQTLLQEYIWQLSSSETWRLNYQNVIGFTSPGITQIKEDGLEIYGRSLLPEFINLLKNKNGEQMAVFSEGAESTRLEESWHSYRQTIKPAHGNFGLDETITVKINIEGNENLSMSRLSITRPTNLLRMQWKLGDNIQYLSPITVRKYIYDDTIDLLRLISEEVVEMSSNEEDDNFNEAQYIEPFPKIGTYYEFIWKYK